MGSIVHQEVEGMGGVGMLLADDDGGMGSENPIDVARNKHTKAYIVKGRRERKGKVTTVRRTDKGNLTMLPRDHASLKKAAKIYAGPDGGDAGPVRSNSEGSKFRLISCGTSFIHPRSEYMRRWDIAVALLMLYVSLVTPYEVAFMSGIDAPVLNVINICVDLLFFKDIMVQFSLAYDDPVSGNLVTERDRIARRYMRSWFFIDLGTILPLNVLVPLMTDVDAGGSKLRLIRILRLLRLGKLARVLKAGKMFQRWERKISVSYASLTIMKLSAETCFVVHWIACVWKLVLDLEANGDVCSFTESEASAYGPLPWIASSDYCGFSNFNLYIVSLYWAVTTISTIGYGDAANPNTTAERIMGILCMIVGSGLYAYVLGAICAIVGSLGQETLLFRDQMDQISSFCDEAQIPVELRDRIKEYYRQRRVIRKEENFNSIQNILSPTIRGEVAVFLNRDWIGEVEWVETGGVAFVTDLAMLLSTHLHAPMELASGRYLHIVVKGVAVKDSRVLASGCTWGKDMILEAPNLKRPRAARAISYLHTKALTKDMFEILMSKYPRERHRVRMESLWLGLKRGVMLHRQHLAIMFHQILALSKDERGNLLAVGQGWIPRAVFEKNLKKFAPRLLPVIIRAASLHFSMKSMHNGNENKVDFSEFAEELQSVHMDGTHISFGPFPKVLSGAAGARDSAVSTQADRKDRTLKQTPLPVRVVPAVAPLGSEDEFTPNQPRVHFGNIAYQDGGCDDDGLEQRVVGLEKSLLLLVGKIDQMHGDVQAILQTTSGPAEMNSRLMSSRNSILDTSTSVHD
jgi:potassium voltage-gated channel Eag-related subfamily H protein 7